MHGHSTLVLARAVRGRGGKYAEHVIVSRQSIDELVLTCLLMMRLQMAIQACLSSRGYRGRSGLRSVRNVNANDVCRVPLEKNRLALGMSVVVCSIRVHSPSSNSVFPVKDAATSVNLPRDCGMLFEREFKQAHIQRDSWRLRRYEQQNHLGHEYI